MHFLEIATDGPITIVTLNRPAVLNAINPAMHQELQEALDGFAEDPAQRVCVLTGAGERAFCAGTDLKAAAEGMPGGYPRSGYAGLIERFDCNKPIIAAVNGIALGGGFEIALACDIVVASENAVFGLPEPLIGAVALGGGLHRLARQLPLKQAMGMILAARQIGAADALRMGFVNEVVPQDALMATTLRWCHDILRSAPVAIEASKAIVARGLAESSIEAAMQAQPGYPEFVAWQSSEDLREGIQAFAQKRKPHWTGR